MGGGETERRDPLISLKHGEGGEKRCRAKGHPAFMKEASNTTTQKEKRWGRIVKLPHCYEIERV